MGFLADGKIKELEFSKLFENVIHSGKKQDIEEHWDVEIDGKKFDVKGLKKISRNDTDKNEFYHFIEIRNVNGNQGWMYGKADFIAFETHDYWVIVDRLKLRDYIEGKVSKTLVKTPDESLYCCYRREGRLDIITMVKTIDLMVISDEIIKKKEGINHEIGESIIIEKRDKQRVNKVLNKKGL
jgi:hypothetical protein